MMHPYVQVMDRKRQRESMNGHAVPVVSKPVRWTPEEAERVAHASYRILNAEHISSIAAVLRGQEEALEPHRHRSIRQMKDIESAIIPIWKSLRAAEPEKQPDADASSSSTEPVPAPEETAAEPVPECPPVQSIDGPDVAPTANADAHVEEFVARATNKNAPEPDERKAMVRWTDAEKLIVARESKRLRASFADMTPLEAIRKAVFGYLPGHRQRTITTMAEVKWIHELWQQIDAVEQAEARERAAAADSAKAEAIAEAVKPAKAAPVNLPDLSIESLIRALAMKIGRQLIRGLGEQIQEAVMRQVINTLQGIPMQPGALPEGTTRVHTPPRERKPRVTVVGLLNQQAEDVKRAFADAVEFTFIKSQQVGGSGGHGGAGMLARGAQADVVLSMVDFTGHDVDAASKHLDVPFVRVNGSVSALKRWLSHWLNGEVALARH
ncbi:hypothetical protein FVF58_00915 [Paraburkholderia panacisoli]|uniref:DUF2325 domain-containing protein n=1 Tax=Paraburkholderia panacisoli TaxID=2603818 RepID=A0A5B0HL16_9BURK|nr:hypothetical protein [Paraburkholderia panacisoli]KAA1015947.1 hypothetical protein FVF58_00915 [Paraburkholderia panacisoli]